MFLLVPPLAIILVLAAVVIGLLVYRRSRTTR